MECNKKLIFINSSESSSDSYSSVTKDSTKNEMNDDETESINDIDKYEIQNLKVNSNITNTIYSLKLQKKDLINFINMSLISRITNKIVYDKQCFLK